jgi:hypothetical protein
MCIRDSYKDNLFRSPADSWRGVDNNSSSVWEIQNHEGHHHPPSTHSKHFVTGRRTPSKTEVVIKLLPVSYKSCKQVPGVKPRAETHSTVKSWDSALWIWKIPCWFPLRTRFCSAHIKLINPFQTITLPATHYLSHACLPACPTPHFVWQMTRLASSSSWKCKLMGGGAGLCARLPDTNGLNKCWHMLQLLVKMLREYGWHGCPNKSNLRSYLIV